MNVFEISRYPEPAETESGRPDIMPRVFELADRYARHELRHGTGHLQLRDHAAEQIDAGRKQGDREQRAHRRRQQGEAQKYCSMGNPACVRP